MDSLNQSVFATVLLVPASYFVSILILVVDGDDWFTTKWHASFMIRIEVLIVLLLPLQFIKIICTP